MRKRKTITTDSTPHPSFHLSSFQLFFDDPVIMCGGLGGRVYRNKRARVHDQLDQLDNVGVDPVGTVRAGQGGREAEGTTGRVQVESGKGGSVCKERVRGRGMESTNVGMGRKGRKKKG